MMLIINALVLLALYIQVHRIHQLANAIFWCVSFYIFVCALVLYLCVIILLFEKLYSAYSRQAAHERLKYNS